MQVVQRVRLIGRIGFSIRFRTAYERADQLAAGHHWVSVFTLESRLQVIQVDRFAEGAQRHERAIVFAHARCAVGICLHVFAVTVGKKDGRSRSVCVQPNLVDRP